MNNEMKETIDPGTQLVKSLQVLLHTLQEDMEAKRAADSDLARLVLQGQQQEISRSEQLQKTIDTKINEFDKKYTDLNTKIDDHEE